MNRVIGAVVRPIRRAFRPTQAALANIQLCIDEIWYLKTYPDAAASGLDATEHFLQRGAWEGRRPNRYFDPTWYAQRHVDAAGQLPIVHYALRGRRLRYDPGPDFSVAAYLATHQDVATNGMDPLDHYIRHGQYEQRTIAPARTPQGFADPALEQSLPQPTEIWPGSETLTRIKRTFAQRDASMEMGPSSGQSVQDSKQAATERQ